jgi:carboxyl-terminal processing protease
MSSNQDSGREALKTGPTPIRIALAGFSALLVALLSFSSGFVVAALQPGVSEWTTDTWQPGGSGGPILSDENPATLEVFTEAWELIEADFFGPLPSETERVYGAIRGLLTEVGDPYTVFVEPVPHKFDQEKLRGSYGGIGVDLSRNDKGYVVLTPIRGSPASRAGIEEGDILVAVDDLTITADMDASQDVTALLRGEPGTDVVLLVRRRGQEIEFVVTREVIDTPSVHWRLLAEETPPLAYVEITSFTDRTPSELAEALTELLDRDGATGLVLDLRNNGGGLLHSSIDVVDQFLDGGIVLYEVKRGSVEKSFSAEPGGNAVDVPLVVLVNNGTASASEIVAGAIQDRDRGILVGQTTYGKGSVQLIFDLSDGASLHLTSAQWLTPNRHQLEGVGLTPDVSVKDDEPGGVDMVLDEATDILRSGLR